jgi:hypothetical protein
MDEEELWALATRRAVKRAERRPVNWIGEPIFYRIRLASILSRLEPDDQEFVRHELSDSLSEDDATDILFGLPDHVRGFVLQDYWYHSGVTSGGFHKPHALVIYIDNGEEYWATTSAESEFRAMNSTHCPKCQIGFTSLKAFDTHIREHRHRNPGRIRTLRPRDVCDMNVKAFAGLREKDADEHWQDVGIWPVTAFEHESADAARKLRG